MPPTPANLLDIVRVDLRPRASGEASPGRSAVSKGHHPALPALWKEWATATPYSAILKPADRTFTTAHLDVCQHSGR